MTKKELEPVFDKHGRHVLIPRLENFTCICPKCRRKHTFRMAFTGRGIPRKRCTVCKISLRRSTGMNSIEEPFWHQKFKRDIK